MLIGFGFGVESVCVSGLWLKPRFRAKFQLAAIA